ncbi:MAG: hypothetical protein HN849_20015 [Victivallales bacterium]|nr:hypothetical protein [Victivallales bacterium]
MAIKKAVGVHKAAAILLAVVCLAGVGQGQEKPRAKKPEKAGKPAKAEKKGKAAGLQLDEEARKRVKDNPEIAALVTLRADLDELFAEYRSLGLTKGVKTHQKATRKLPSLGNRVVKARDKLAALTDRQLGPLEKNLKRDKAREEKLIRKMDKMGDGANGKGIEKMEKTLDDLRTAIGEQEDTADLLALIGQPEMPVVPAPTMLLEELLKPNEQEEGTLRSLIKKHGNLMTGRLMILHLQADLKRAKEGTKDAPANPERAKSTKRQLAQVEKKFTKYFLNIWAPIAKQRQELLDERDELQKKAARLAGRPAAKKHEEKLASVERKLDGDKRTNALYKRIARGTLAEKELVEQAKEKEEGKDTKGKRPRKRKR